MVNNRYKMIFRKYARFCSAWARPSQDGLVIFGVCQRITCFLWLSYMNCLSILEREQNVTLGFYGINAEFEALTLVFSQVVEMSRCLCRSELLLFSSFTTKKLRQTCQLTGPITYPTGPWYAADSVAVRSTCPALLIRLLNHFTFHSVITTSKLIQVWVF